MAKRLCWIHFSLCLLAIFRVSYSFLPNSVRETPWIERKNHRRRPMAHPASRQWKSALWSSTKQPSSAAAGGTKKSHVVYQKVVRPPAGLPDILFLGYLVEYLQDKFELPIRLPMVYEAAIPDDDDENEGVEDRHIVRWDSPLSPNPDATCMSVEVVGIIADKGDDEKNKSSAVPNMAMVVVRKEASSDQASADLPPMLQNLFADSEKRILKALDRGLEEFVAGKIPFDDDKPQAPKASSNLQEAQEAILAEIMEEDAAAQEISSKNKPADAIEATIVEKNGVANSKSNKKDGSDDDAALKAKRQAVLQSMQAKASAEPISSSKGLDFAVQAAKHAAAKRKQTGAEDFAVAAAKKANSQKKHQVKPKKRPSKSPDVVQTTEDTESIDPAQLDLSRIRPPSLDPNAAGPRAFMKTISRPEDYATTRKSQAKGGKEVKDAKSMDGPTPRKSQKVPANVSVANSAKSLPRDEAERKINLKVLENVSEPTPGRFDATNLTAEEREIAQTAQDALTEIAESGKDMTAEELLEDVLKFGEKKDKEDTVGEGFVSGAFEKAKDLLREQKQKREDRLRRDVVEKVTTKVQGLAPDIRDPTEIKGVEELSPEDELRQMFQAGERIADGRITKAASSELDTEPGTTDKDVDSLIAADRTVSSHARILDDELAELELRINKSPGEEFDGPKKNPVFDIFSGPEVYDPNVDPETVVNWPGALPGTRDIRLPKELDQAVKQARFAAEILSNLSEMEVDTEAGVKEIKYTVGERELTEQQIHNLRTVVNEAVEIGLIEDPLNYKAEESRLQMLLDELREQPEERTREIASNYKDLLLSDNFVRLIKERMNRMADLDLEALRRDDDSLEKKHARERELLGQLVVYAQLLLKEVRALGAELEAQQLEVIRSICKVAMDPSHQTEEETAMALTDAVRDMRPLLDDAFVAYLKYAVAEEEGRLARAGVLDDPEHNQWLFVLKIVQQGVYSELARGINRYVDHIWYVLRMETPIERRMLLEKLIDVMPTLDVRPFVQVVDNIVASLSDSVKGDFDGVTELGEMTNKLLQLRKDVKELLPPERIALMSRDADEWAAKQKQRLLEQRNLTKQRLKAARDTEHLDDEIESLGRRGEMERFD